MCTSKQIWLEEEGDIVDGEHDDMTDVDAFVALRSRNESLTFKGAAIGVIGEETPRAVEDQADCTLYGVIEVERFLTWLVEATDRLTP